MVGFVTRSGAHTVCAPGPLILLWLLRNDHSHLWNDTFAAVCPCSCISQKFSIFIVVQHFTNEPLWNLHYSSSMESSGFTLYSIPANQNTLVNLSLFKSILIIIAKITNRLWLKLVKIFSCLKFPPCQEALFNLFFLVFSLTSTCHRCNNVHNFLSSLNYIVFCASWNLTVTNEYIIHITNIYSWSMLLYKKATYICSLY